MWADLVTGGVFFYLGFWAGHEHYEDVGPNHPHPFGPHYWKLGTGLVLLWFFVVVPLRFPWVWERPLLLLGGGTTLVLACGSSLPWNPNGLPWTPACVGAGVTLLLFLICHPIFLVWTRAGRGIPVARTKEDLLLAAKEGRFPVAEGWSFWLQERRAPSPSVLVRWEGVCESGGGRERVLVRAGTRMGSLSSHLRSYGKALKDRAQFDSLSVGGAVRTRSHGFSAEEWFSSFVTGVEGVRRGGSGTPKWARRGDSDFETILSSQDWILLRVEVEVTDDLPYSVTRKRRFDHEEWKRAKYRMMLIGRFGTLVTLAKEEEEEEKANPPPPPPLFPTRLRNFLFVCAGGVPEPTRLVSLSRLHTVVESMWPIEMLFLRLLRWKNVEIFTTDPVSLPRLVEKVTSFHKQRGGHTEVRQGGGGRIALDLATIGSLSPYWSLLHREGIRTVTLHPGKYVPKDVSPLRIK